MYKIYQVILKLNYANDKLLALEMKNCPYENKKEAKTKLIKMLNSTIKEIHHK